MQKAAELVESRTEILDLTEAQADVLSNLGRQLASRSEFWGTDDQDSRERSVVRCRAIGAGKYEIVVRNAVGRIALPDLLLSVKPKIPQEHFMFLASRGVGDIRLGRMSVSLDTGTDLTELLHLWALTLVKSAIARGLRLDYRSEIENLPLVRGRIDVRGTISNIATGKAQFRCRFEDLSPNTPANRVFKRTIELGLVRGSGQMAERLNKLASSLIHRFDEVGSFDQSDLHALRASLNLAEERALALCKLIIAGRGVSLDSGNLMATSYLIPAPPLIESGVRNIIASGLPTIRVAKQRKVLSWDPYFSVNPDLVIGSGSTVGDIKYKISLGGIDRDHVSQIVLFAKGFAALSGIVVEFKDSSIPLRLEIGDLPVHLVSWDISISPEDAQKMLLKQVHTALSEHAGQAARLSSP